MNRQHTNSEDTITTLFVEILMPMSATWRIHEQTTQPLVENQRKPDVIIRTVERHPMCSVSEIAKLGAGTKDICGGAGRGAFDVESGCSNTAEYPSLWHVHSESQRATVVP